MVGLLAGCGGRGGGDQQQISGNGYRFSAPTGWTVTRTATSSAAASGPVRRVEVDTFRLVRAYRPQLFPETQRELDGVAARIAGQLHGRVDARSVVRAAGRQAWSYTIGYRGTVQQITFVFDGLREFELLCRRPAALPNDPACPRLVAGFALASTP